MDALVIKIRDAGRVTNHHAYLAIGINDLGIKDVLGLWITKGLLQMAAGASGSIPLPGSVDQSGAFTFGDGTRCSCGFTA